MYAHTRLSFADIARLGAVEGWRDHRGQLVSRRAVATLLGNEALVGTFVWGRRKVARSLAKFSPSRGEGSVPRLVDDQLWAQVQSRTSRESSRKKTDDQIAASLVKALDRDPLLTARDLDAHGLPSKATLRARFGGWNECLKQAGADPELHDKLVLRARERRQRCREFGMALAGTLNEHRHLVAYDGRRNVLTFIDLFVRIRLLWPSSGVDGQVWRFRIERTSQSVDADLIVRMDENASPKDYFVAEPDDVVARFPQWLADPIPLELRRFWCRSQADLLGRISSMCARAAAEEIGETTGGAPGKPQAAAVNRLK